VASSDSTLSGGSFATLANLTSSLLKIPPALQPSLDLALDHLSRASDVLQATTGLSSAAIYTTAGALLLLGLVPAVASRSISGSKTSKGKGSKMSRYGWSTRQGLSPFSSGFGQGIPDVTEDDFSYITSEDLQDNTIDRPYDRYAHHIDHYAHSAPGPRSSFIHSAPIPRGSFSNYQEPPRPEDDVMLIKCKNVTYPARFPAYSIGDGQLLVDDVRERIKILLDISERQARRMRLYYKGRQLNSLHVPVREYGVKNNSEVLVVIGEGGESGGDSSEEIVVVGTHDSYLPASEPTKSRKKRRGRQRDDRGGPRDSGSSLGLDFPFEDGSRRRGKSTVRTQSPARSSVSGLSGASGASGASSLPPVTGRPGGPIEKLNEISSNFNTTLLPLCLTFTVSPPTDPKKRDDEHRRLSETVLAQVLLKLDGVDTSTEDGARARRKELVNQVQKVLKGLDDAKAGKR